MSDEANNGLEESDEWLVQALREEDPQVVNAAMEALQSRYGPKIKNYARKLVGGHKWVEVEDIVQETLIGFWKYTKTHQVKKGVRSLLMGIAHNKCATVLDKQTKEMKLENDIPLPEQVGVEEILEEKEFNQFFNQLPFSSPLSDCQRVVLVMRSLFHYTPRIVARLMDKSRGTIDTHFSAANKQVEAYLKSEDFELDLASQEWPKKLYDTVAQKPDLIVERFANLVTPQFTPEELKPLGLTVEEFQTNYAASVLLPWEPSKKGDPGYLSMVLTRRQDLESMQEMFKRLSKDRTDTDQISAEECLLKVEINNDNIILTVEQMLEFLPEPEEWRGTSLSENTSMLVHRPRMSIPVTLGFFDNSLFTDDLYERWPFLTEDVGL